MQKKRRWMYFRMGICMVLLLTVCKISVAQKRELSNEVYRQWRLVRNARISDSGKWIVGYINYLNRSIVSSDDRVPEVFVYNTENRRSFSIKNAVGASVFAREKWLYCKVQSFDSNMFMKDSVFFLNLQTMEKKVWNKKQSCNVVSGSNSVYWEEAQDNCLKVCMWDILTNDTIVVDSVVKYNFHKHRKLISYLKKEGNGCGLYVGKTTGKHTLIYKNNDGLLLNYKIDESGETGEFLVASDSVYKDNPDLLYSFSLPDRKYSLRIDFKTIKAPEGYRVHSYCYGIERGQKYFSPVLEPDVVTNKREEFPDKQDINVQVWGWNDNVIPSRSKSMFYGQFIPKYLYDLIDKRWILLSNSESRKAIVPYCDDYNYVLEIDNAPYLKQMDWKERAYYDLYLKELSSGEEQLIAKDLKNYPLWDPDGRYALVYNAKEKKWYSLEASTANWQEIGQDIPYPVYKENFDEAQDAPAYGFHGWVKGCNAVVLADKYDLWVVYLDGKQKSYCLTKGYGRRFHQELRVIQLGEDIFKSEINQYEIDLQKELLLKSINERTRSEGVCQYYKGKVQEVIEIPYAIRFLDVSENGQKWIWIQQSYSESPDIWCCDRDGSNLNRVTRTNPQQDLYNWGSVKIVEWTTFSGKTNRGLLYLPENYDSSKKYPVIVNFYEHHSDYLHRYWFPVLSNATINIPTYVSQGYVVFMPDVHYTVGEPGESCYDAVVSGTEMLIQKGIADEKRIGLQGHSFGGFQVVYLLTRTNLFCCAQPGAAVVNMVSAYTALRGDGSPRMYMYEQSQSRIGKTLWEDTEKYLANSTILYADKINCPLLIFHNDQDEAVPFSQGLDLFFAMRRLQKPAWLINYRGQKHFLSGELEQEDWTKKMQQFFDYYLKDKSKPLWMEDK